MRLLGNLARMGVRLPTGLGSGWTDLFAAGERQIDALRALNDPRGIYMLCECGLR